MKRRIGGAALTGLGGGGKEIMDGKSSGSKKYDKLVNACAKDCYETFFKGTKMDYEGVDAGVKQGEVTVGYEPSYMYERLKIIIIDERKEASRMETGYSWGGWGTDIRKTTRWYKDCKTKSKFVRFVDKWHDILFVKKML